MQAGRPYSITYTHRQKCSFTNIEIQFILVVLEKYTPYDYLLAGINI